MNLKNEINPTKDGKLFKKGDTGQLGLLAIGLMLLDRGYEIWGLIVIGLGIAFKIYQNLK